MRRYSVNPCRNKRFKIQRNRNRAEKYALDFSEEDDDRYYSFRGFMFDRYCYVRGYAQEDWTEDPFVKRCLRKIFFRTRSYLESSYTIGDVELSFPKMAMDASWNKALFDYAYTRPFRRVDKRFPSYYEDLYNRCLYIGSEAASSVDKFYRAAFAYAYHKVMNTRETPQLILCFNYFQKERSNYPPLPFDGDFLNHEVERGTSCSKLRENMEIYI